MVIDRFGCETAGSETSLAAWETAWERYTHFRGSPLDALADANGDDDEFVLGPVMTALYSVLAGTALNAAVVADNLARARRRASRDDRRALGHLQAVEHVCAGDFTAGADAFMALAGDAGTDFAALRFAHDLYLHVGAAQRRFEREAELLARWPSDDPQRHLAEGMHAFSLTEIGLHDQARRLGEAALAADPEDMWARHALAHVFENTDDTARSLKLLADKIDVWEDQDLLAVHMWWHLGLRLLAAGDIATVLQILDQQMADADTAFELCDQTSLLWRAECAGFCVGDRWDAVADRWDQVAERHTCAFVDLHAALAWIRRPGHSGAERWFAGLAARAPVDPVGRREIDDIFATVAVPLIDALRSDDPAAAVSDDLLAGVRRIGGSEAQRRVVDLTLDRPAGGSTPDDQAPDDPGPGVWVTESGPGDPAQANGHLR